MSSFNSDPEDRKRLKRIISALPYDCWCYTSTYLSEFKDFKAILLSVRGLYDYIKNQNSYATQNRIFILRNFPLKGVRYGHVHRVKIGGRYITNRTPVLFKNVGRLNILSVLFDSFPNLSSFSLDCRGFTNLSKPRTVISIGRGLKTVFPNLREIEVLHGSDFTVRLQSDIFPSISKIHIGGGTVEPFYDRSGSYYNPNSMAEFFCFGTLAPLTKLRHLVISSELFRVNPSLIELITPKLVTIQLNNTNLKGVYEEFSDLKNLEELRLDDVNGKGLKIMNLPNLRILEIKKGRLVGNWDIHFSTLTGLEEAYLEHVQIKNPERDPFFENKKLRSLILDAYGTVKKIDDPLGSMFDRRGVIWNGQHVEMEKLSLGECNSALEKLRITTSITPLSILSVPGLKILDLYIDTNEIVVEDDFLSMKKTLEKVVIRQRWKETYFPNRGVSVSFLKGTHSFSRQLLYFSKFVALKELILYNYLVPEVSIVQCPLLEKFEFRFSSSFPRVVRENPTDTLRIDGCENLKELRLEDNVSSYTILKNCKGLKKLYLRHSNRYPRGLSLTGLTDLSLVECGSSLFNGRTLDGRAFPSLKNLFVVQRFFDERIVRQRRGEDDSSESEDFYRRRTNKEDPLKREVAVQKLVNMEHLQTFRLRVRSFSDKKKSQNGIVQIRPNLSTKCQVIVEEGTPSYSGRTGFPQLFFHTEKVFYRDRFDDFDVSITRRRKMNGEEFMRLFNSCKIIVDLKEGDDDDDEVLLIGQTYHPRRETGNNNNNNNNNPAVVISISDSDQEGDGEDDSQNIVSSQRSEKDFDEDDVIVIDDD